MKKSNKELSVIQENHVADVLEGRRTKASGGAKHDPGDVVSVYYLTECKVTRNGSISVSKYTWDKIRNETHSGRDPLMALRFVDENDKSTHDLFVIDKNDLVELLEESFYYRNECAC